ELYFHSAYDSTVAPPHHHVMSVFAQYAPYELAQGTWDAQRERVADAALAEISRIAPDLVDCVVERQVLAPPDIEREVGLAGGHTFQGDCLPHRMRPRGQLPPTPPGGL